MGKAIQLAIPNACHENWHNMTVVQQGRHCMSCNKTVVDFTNMSDREILHHIANAGGSRVCGRLNPDQMHRSITMQKKSRGAWLKYFFQFTLPAFLISMKAEGQEPGRKGVDTVQVQSPVRGQVIIINDTISGTVVDPDGNALPGAVVEIQGSAMGTTTDQKGCFSITWPKDKNLVLIIRYVGFKPLKKKMKAKNRSGQMKLRMKLDYAVLGEVIVT